MRAQNRKADSRETYLAANLTPKLSKVTPAAKADIAYFAKRAAEGSAISQNGLKRWLEEKHGAKMHRDRLLNIIRECGLEPWWST